MKKKLVCSLGLSLILFACSHDQQSVKEQSSISSLNYTVLKEEIDDVPAYTNVLTKVLVSEQITKDSLQRLLNQLYSDIMKRKFKYHDVPHTIYIWLYASRDDAETDSQSIAVLVKEDIQPEPKISFNETQLTQLIGKWEEKLRDN